MTAWQETRPLTPADEDLLTDALGEALETDVAFRGAYEEVLLAPLSTGNRPRITSVRSQVHFPDHGSRPDLLLGLDDGRRMACEHKIKAPETVGSGADGRVAKQLERYLGLPGVDAVTYFRPTWREPLDAILAHPRYLHPAGHPHYLWRHLHDALRQGETDVCRWLLEGFDLLGFTPPRPQVGPLRSQVDKENFGKLWDALVERLFADWRREHGTLSTLYLTPRMPSPIRYVFLDARVDGGRSLRMRIRLNEVPDGEWMATLRERVADVAGDLPAPASVRLQRLSDGDTAVDVTAALSEALGSEDSAVAQQAGLLREVKPIADALAHGA